ncbi:MAG: FAD-dependent oxidoreductase [Bdellovibrionales bacterium]
MEPIYIHTHQKSESLWQKLLSADGPTTRDSNPLNKDLKAQVVVVGAGISGLTTAYLLLKEGYEVVVLDKDSLGRNETGLTSAHLSNALDDGYYNIRKWHGDRGCQLAFESHTAAINTIEQICTAENISCEFSRVSGYLFLGPNQEMRHLIEELTACHVAGFLDVELFPQIPVSFFNSGQTLMFPQQAQFHPIKYMYGLVESVLRLGGKIFWNTQVTDVKGGANAQVITSHNHIVSCNYCVVATNVPMNNRVIVHTKEAAYRTYIIGMKVPHGMMPPMLIWDASDPYHYVRLQSDPNKKEDILIIGGEDHRVGQKPANESPYKNLKLWAKKVLKIDYPISCQWSGQIVEPTDGLAYVGHNPRDHRNVFIATGDSGHGLTHGTIAGLLLKDLICGKTNEWAKLYDPRRKNWKELGSYLKENINTAAQYGDWLAGGIDSVKNIKPREGGIITQGLSKVAVYKDSDGETHTFSATCPHLGGVVRWNTVEKTWDCPCHGSRFNCYGEVINGPANVGLSEAVLPLPQQPPPKSPPMRPSASSSV